MVTRGLPLTAKRVAQCHVTVPHQDSLRDAPLGLGAEALKAGLEPHGGGRRESRGAQRRLLRGGGHGGHRRPETLSAAVPQVPSLVDPWW